MLKRSILWFCLFAVFIAMPACEKLTLKDEVSTSTTTSTTTTQAGGTTTTSTTTTTQVGTTTTTQAGATTTTTVAHVVLAEVFTATWCVWCPYADKGVERLASEEGVDKLVVLEYHISDAYSVTGNSSRASYLGIQGYPTVVFDGTAKKVGANPDSGSGSDYEQLCYDAYKKVLTGRSTLESLISITGEATVANKIVSLNATLANVGNTTLSNLIANAVVYEDLGQSEFKFVVRNVLPSQEVSSLGVGASESYNVTSLALTSEANVSNIAVVVFVQKSDTKEILSSKKISL